MIATTKASGETVGRIREPSKGQFSVWNDTVR